MSFWRRLIGTAPAPPAPERSRRGPRVVGAFARR